MKTKTLYIVTVFIISIQVSFASEIHDAAVANDIPKVKELVLKGYDIEEKDAEPGSKYEAPKGTPLHWAVKAGKEEMVNFLINIGANVNAQTFYGACLILETPLDYAVMNNHKNIVLKLLKAGANVESAGHNFHWPLVSAIKIKAYDIADILLKYNANINRSGVDGYTALHTAINKCHIESVKYLLNKGADVNYKDNRFGENAQSPLQLAEEKGCKDIVNLLIENGAK